MPWVRLYILLSAPLHMATAVVTTVLLGFVWTEHRHVQHLHTLGTLQQIAFADAWTSFARQLSRRATTR
jgi:hypothetical protein